MNLNHPRSSGLLNYPFSEPRVATILGSSGLFVLDRPWRANAPQRGRLSWERRSVGYCDSTQGGLGLITMGLECGPWLLSMR